MGADPRPLGRKPVSAEQLQLDTDKEKVWMAAHADQCVLLEDTMYRRLESLWGKFSDALAVFNTNGSDEPLCAQKVWEQLLATSPLTHERMRT